MTTEKKDISKHWWIAINGASCAANLTYPIGEPMVRPVPETLIGFPTREEAAHAQIFMLNAPHEELEPQIRKWFAREDVRVIQPANPEPPTEGSTGWLDFSADDGGYRRMTNIPDTYSALAASFVSEHYAQLARAARSGYGQMGRGAILTHANEPTQTTDIRYMTPDKIAARREFLRRFPVAAARLDHLIANYDPDREMVVFVFIHGPELRACVLNCTLVEQAAGVVWEVIE